MAPSGMAIDLSDVLGAMAGDDDDNKKKNNNLPLPEAQVATLEEFFEAYKKEDPFEAGDIVTPYPGTSSIHVGIPHIVLETRYDAEPFFEGESSSSGFGRRPDIRVLCCVGDTYAAFWCEAWQFKPWTLNDYYDQFGGGPDKQVSDDE